MPLGQRVDTIAMVSVRVWDAHLKGERREGIFGQREQYQQRHRGSEHLELLTGRVLGSYMSLDL